MGGPYPFDYAYLGSWGDHVSKPDPWDPQGHAFGLRISGTVFDGRFTLNGYYGRSHELARSALGTATTSIYPWDGRLELHPDFEAYYPIFKFLGASFTKDIDCLRAAALGNVAPVVRFEGLYAFNSTFSSNDGNVPFYIAKQGDNFWKSDELRLMVGADWKVRINPLNSRNFFFISAQGYWRHINDYPSDGIHLGNSVTDIVYRNEMTTTLLINTQYMTSRLQPSVFWLRNWATRGEFWKFALSYEQNQTWKYTIGAFIYSGAKATQDLQPYNYKDHVFATVSYRF
ncbi:MAG: hypothetical protein A4E65_00152 [Syntrophorhabdus sp. PtaU1.Bin153]|nr:MAG: hypothetical protein A4E65_00152 [Syntrophorhabdus sp. PtaU1.Bin153]